MLTQLTVKDFALIERAQIEPEKGFNVMTGETGAGKSIIIDAVSLLLGGRANTKDIRYGCEKALVEGVFQPEEKAPVFGLLAELGIDADEGLVVLRREISTNGKNICRINDRTVTLANFRVIGQSLINIYGQHDYQRISNREYHLEMLDSLGDETFRRQKQQLENSYREMMQIRRKKAALEQLLKDRQEKKEFLLFKQKELQDLHLQSGEEEQLEQELSVLDNYEKIVSATEHAYRNLYGDTHSVYSQLTDAVSELEKVEGYHDSLKQILEELRNMQAVAEDFGLQLSSFADNTEFDENRRNQLNERKYILDRAKRKYQCSMEELLEQRDRIDAEIRQLEHGDDEMAELNRRFKEQKQQYLQLAESLRAVRYQLAEEMTRRVLAELRELAMENTRLEVRFTPCNPTAHGMDEVEFFLSANPGQPLRELREIASGGEMSRIMLAFQTVLAEKEQIGTLIFDEIDTGIGGNILTNVAEKLRDVSQHAQVLCVTHAPILAAKASRHFRIRKLISENHTVTEISGLNSEEQITELARMLGGEESFHIEHAKALKGQG